MPYAHDPKQYPIEYEALLALPASELPQRFTYNSPREAQNTRFRFYGYGQALRRVSENPQNPYASRAAELYARYCQIVITLDGSTLTFSDRFASLTNPQNNPMARLLHTNNAAPPIPTQPRESMEDILQAAGYTPHKNSE